MLQTSNEQKKAIMLQHKDKTELIINFNYKWK